ncbi:hypothetical protein GCM10009808_24300 [Microbacterium sediminicola]|uniref:HTH gntR-type domain-containing protein n=1 Tax=Microbacterium sediminicola TaxID=415210 RepID=A0ABN2II19_9MICO
MTDRVAPSVRDRLMSIWREAATQSVPLPSEPQLAAELGVSRSRIREELLRLEGEGLVMRSAGSGTFANAGALHLGLRLNQSFEYAHMLEEAGFEPTTEVLAAGWAALDARDADALGLAVGHSAYRTQKRWLADGVPVMLAVDLIPAHPRPTPVDPATSVYELVHELRGISGEWENAKVLARIPTADERDLLVEHTAEAAILDLEMTGTDRFGTAIYLSREVHRQGVIDYSVIRRVRTTL